jgi:hypothetical protein
MVAQTNPQTSGNVSVLPVTERKGTKRKVMAMIVKLKMNALLLKAHTFVIRMLLAISTRVMTVGTTVCAMKDTTGTKHTKPKARSHIRANVLGPHFKRIQCP